jgi:bifunctional DNase/RNase
MNKIRLEIFGLSYSQTQSGAYALVLAEVGGSRRLPIIIGGFEAQAIAIELEKMKPSRPLTHDLFRSLAVEFDILVKEIYIYKLQEGIFYAKIICESNGDYKEIDARTSDAIAIGVRFNCPIFTTENILSSSGILMDESNQLLGADESETSEESMADLANPLHSRSTDELNDMLEEALGNEDYELASQIRDEINKRQSY